VRTRCFRGLVKICGECGILPNPYIIPGSKIQRLGKSPIASGGFSDVWPGMYGEDESVAIKVIRYYESDDIQKIKKVSCFEPWPAFSSQPTMTICRISAERLSFGSVCRTRTYWS